MTEPASSFIADWKSGKDIFQITTSGSTGAPKTIHLRREQMIKSARKTARALNLSAGMNALVCLDTRYVAGIMMLVRSMEVGMEMLVVSPVANPLKQISPDTRIDFVALVPYQLEEILKDKMESRLSRAVVILGGAPLSESLLQKIGGLQGNFYATFGMTETISHVALQKLNGTDRQHFFHALAGISFSTDERGCLVIDSDYLDGAIVTNDIIELRSSSEFKWIGRHDNIINSGGVKIMPEKVEREIQKWMETQTKPRRFFVSSMPHETLGNEAVLFIEGIHNPKDDLKLFQFLAANLARYEVPKAVYYRKKFAETATGKIDRVKSMIP